MRTIFLKKYLCLLVPILLLVTCTGCHDTSIYSEKEFFTALCDKAGIPYDIDDMEAWGLPYRPESENEPLCYDVLVKSLYALKGEEGNLNRALEDLWISPKTTENDLVEKEYAEYLLETVVDAVNHREFETTYSFDRTKSFSLSEYPENGVVSKVEYDLNDVLYVEEKEMFFSLSRETEEGFVLCEMTPEEVLNHFSFSSSREINFDQVEIDYPSSKPVDSGYINNRYQLLAAQNKTHVVEIDGYRVTYAFSGTSMEAHVSKKTTGGLLVYGDLSVSHIKPIYKWECADGKLKNAYFRLTFKDNEKIGARKEENKNLYLSYKDLSSTDFWSRFTNSFQSAKDAEDVTITLATVTLPVEGIPSLSLKFQFKLHLYAGGKAELLIDNTHDVGFEVRNGSLRFINEHSHSLNPNLKAGLKATLGFNFSLAVLNRNLTDIELESGAEAFVKSTVHLFDDDGHIRSVNTDQDYSTLEDASKENENVRICGDVSLNWLMNLKFNSKDTYLNQLGLHKDITVLNEENQIFNNKHHFENGHFVERCTVISRSSTVEKETYISEQIEPERYAYVLKSGQSATILIRSLPKGINSNELKYASENNAIVSVNGNVMTAHSSGSTRIRIFANEQEAYVTVLVSHE